MGFSRNKGIVFLLSLLLLASLAFAESECAKKCAADRDYWTKIGADNAAAKSYYCGVTETNCWSRETVPAGQPDPCWKMCLDPECSPWSKCDAAYQACCAESSRINSDETYKQCIANCPVEVSPTPTTQATATPSPTATPAAQATCSIARKAYSATKFQVVSTQGSVTVTDKNGIVKTPEIGQDIGPDATIATGSGKISLKIIVPESPATTSMDIGDQTTFKFSLYDFENQLASSEHGSIRGTINGGGDFVLVKTTLDSYWAKAGGEKNNPAGQTIAFAKNEETTAAFSSEHCSVRGTLNGGGDFIQGRENGALSFAAAQLASLPTGNVRVSQEGISLLPIIVVAALPGGDYYSSGREAKTDYSVALDGNGNAEYSPSVGSVAVSRTRRRQSQYWKERRQQYPNKGFLRATAVLAKSWRRKEAAKERRPEPWLRELRRLLLRRRATARSGSQSWQ